MPSTVHQWLVLWLARKMVSDGFMLQGCDGKTPQGGPWEGLPRPFVMAGVRPDLWGLSDRSTIGVGEAKTSDDIDTPHTEMQLRAFGRLVKKAGGGARLYVAVSRGDAYCLDHILKKAELLGARQVVRIHVPEILLEETA